MQLDLARQTFHVELIRFLERVSPPSSALFSTVDERDKTLTSTGSTDRAEFGHGCVLDNPGLTAHHLFHQIRSFVW